MYDSRKPPKDLQILCREVGNEFPMKFIAMVVLEGAQIQGNPAKNCIFVKPYDAPYEEDQYLVGSVWQVISKLDVMSNGKWFLYTLSNEKNL